MSMGVTMAAVVVLVVVVVVVGRTKPAGAIASTGRELVDGVPATPEAIALLERWRDRAARWRTTLALPAVLGAAIAGMVLRASIDVGLGAHPAWSDPLLAGLLSVFVGAMAAELHHLRRRGEGRRVADLTPRVVSTYLPAGARRRSVLLAVLAAAASVTAASTGERAVPWLGLAALVIAGSVPLVQRGIVVRARPALAADLRAADDAVRRLAVRSVDEAGAGAVLLLTAWQLAPVYATADVPLLVGAAMVVSQLTALVIAVVWWRRSNPRRLLPDVPAALTGVDASRLAR